MNVDASLVFSVVATVVGAMLSGMVGLLCWVGTRQIAALDRLRDEFVALRERVARIESLREQDHQS